MSASLEAQSKAAEEWGGLTVEELQTCEEVFRGQCHQIGIVHVHIDSEWKYESDR